MVVCEGAVTEREYFEAFRRWCKNPRAELDFENPAGVPVTLVNRAKARREQAERAADRAGDDFLRYDEVWCVFDVDEHPGVREARANAMASGLQLAMSNPCFELWLLLHFVDSPGMQHRHEIQRRLHARMPDVADKHVDFEALAAGYDAAYRRAERLAYDARARGDDVVGNPSTEVHRLTNSIDEDGAQRRTRRTIPREDGRARAAAAAEAAARQVEDELRAHANDELTSGRVSLVDEDQSD